ncbi:MAG: alpha/beta hydrolase [Acidimicrobiia bacterium]|nr:MAG: alpha/beta hydrolase [Acidimicrobiia bacterium]
MSETEGSFDTSDGTELFTRSWTIENPRYEVLLVHGLGEHSGRWTEPMSHLVARGASVYTYDLRGHGRSGGDRIDIDRFDQFYADISEMAGATVAVSGRPWVLYGHSLGGLQAAGYLIADLKPQPNIAVLSAPAMVADVPVVLRAAASIFGRIAPRLRVANSIKGEQLSKDPAVGEKYFQDELVEVKATARFGKAVFGEQARLATKVDAISTPTLVIHGADDPLVPPSASAGLAQSEGVERRLYPTLRHELHNEPEGPEVMGDVADWIDSKLF